MPYDSIYQATKSSIQQGLFQLQQKIRQKNEVDLQKQLTYNLLQQQKIYRQQKQKEIFELQKIYSDNLIYNHSIFQKKDPIVNSVLYEETLNYPKLPYSELRQTIRKETEHLEYLKMLEKFKIQGLVYNQTLSKNYADLQYEDSFIKQMSPIKQFQSNKHSANQSRTYNQRNIPSQYDTIYKNLQYDQTLEEDSSTLLEKYNQGIRAQQYYREMQRLRQIEDRMKKFDQKLLNSNLNHKPINQTIRVPSKKCDQTREPDRVNQKPQFATHQNQGNDHQFTVLDDIKRKYEYQSPLTVNNKKIDMFQNKKIGDQINRKNQQRNNLGQQANLQESSDLNLSNKELKNNQQIDSVLKPTPFDRPSTVKILNSTKKSVSKPNRISISPLRSQRGKSKISAYQAYIKQKRSRSKSIKQRNSHNNQLNGSQIFKKSNNPMIKLDPITQQLLEEMLRKQINEKIQSRMQLLNCVFKDLKMRKEQNQIDNLHQRFEIQARGRKEVKTIINNNPKILKKHKMVIE